MASSTPMPHQVAQVQQEFGQSGNMLARLSQRITELENEIRRLTGQNEELTYRLGQFEETLKKSTSDTVLRLNALERGGVPARAPGITSTPTGASTVSSATAVPMATGKTAVSGADKGAKVLGTLRSGSGAAAVARVVKPPSVAKDETPEQQYDRAHTLIVKHRKYGEAERVLRSFIDTYPKHELTSNAHYWLGRTFFVRADYENAAFAFAEGFQKFPEARKAPDNLLNLGMSLARLGKNREACTTYTRLLATYQNADASLKRRVTRERQQAKCRSR
ncbi:MAG: tol-pal system protein YbgF [Proteobacteria bacterium]|nr:tol-pal system protein YbgF [Pseudomonadota bacterium]